MRTLWAKIIERPLTPPTPMPSKNNGGKDAGHGQWGAEALWAEVIERPLTPPSAHAQQK